MTLADRCRDCDQPATCGLGTVALCQWCKWAAQVDILSRHPGWNAPQIGQGAPKREEPGRAPLLECDQCGATWHGTPFMDCPWCQDRPRLAQEVQDSINAARMRDYLERLRHGDTAALAPALTLSARVPGSARQIAETMAKTAKTRLDQIHDAFYADMTVDTESFIDRVLSA